MSAELYPVFEPHGDNTNLHSTAVGGSKPLHRFIKGQPKIIGIVLLVLGSSFFILSITMLEGSVPNALKSITPGFWLGAMFISCGIIYILTEHNPTKKTVTISLALSIVSLLGSFWGAFLCILPGMVDNYWRNSQYDSHYHFNDNGSDIFDGGSDIMEGDWSTHYEFYIFVGATIFIVMSSLAGAALRSTKSQALVVMSTIPTE
ncbi:membrane-spanning 4-domains subfamily A member 4D-like [Diretmus argenteus]